MVSLLLGFAELKSIDIRIGEVHRPYFVAKKYAQEGKGILNSKHRYSLAADIWLTDPTGKKIIWDKSHYLYRELGEFWEAIGGTWGGSWKKPDVYHFELRGRI